MKLPRRNFLYLATSAAALPAFSGVAVAQTYPSRPITVISGVPPGSGTDTFARIFGERMKSTLGQSLLSRASPVPAEPLAPLARRKPRRMVTRSASAMSARMS
jgi:hypothetical protein